MHILGFVLKVEYVRFRLTLYIIYDSIMLYLRCLNMRILFVCTGNICRSAMAHHYMQKKVSEMLLEDEIVVESAGTNAYSGQQSTKDAIEVMKKYDTDLSKHRATYIEEKDLENMDLILCMTKRHKNIIVEKHANLKPKIYTLKEYVSNEEYIDIDDPWGYGIEVYESCSEEIVEYVDKLIIKITEVK